MLWPQQFGNGHWNQYEKVQKLKSKSFSFSLFFYSDQTSFTEINSVLCLCTMTGKKNKKKTGLKVNAASTTWPLRPNKVSSFSQPESLGHSETGGTQSGKEGEGKACERRKSVFPTLPGCCCSPEDGSRWGRCARYRPLRPPYAEPSGTGFSCRWVWGAPVACSGSPWAAWDFAAGPARQVPVQNLVSPLRTTVSKQQPMHSLGLCRAPAF